MHKGLLISGLALVLAGCATSQSEAPPVQVEDLSTGRAASVPAEYTVKSGDTLYGIAWRHDMDYRDLAEMNNIAPPYNIQPGQRWCWVATMARLARRRPEPIAAPDATVAKAPSPLAWRRPVPWPVAPRAVVRVATRMARWTGCCPRMLLPTARRVMRRAPVCPARSTRMKISRLRRGRSGSRRVG